jgi:hypothetical protein
MDKSLLSQILDGAAFPAMILAVAVSQIKAGPHQRNSLHRHERPAAEFQVGDRVEQKLNKRRDIELFGFNTRLGASRAAAPGSSVTASTTRPDRNR